MATQGYEFDREQNLLIADLAGKMSSVGIFLVAAGTLSLMVAAVSIGTGRPGPFVALILAGAFFLATGIWTVRGGRAFRAVVDTEGNDSPLVMHALNQLERFYTLNFWLVVIYLMTVLLTFAGCPEGLG